MQKAIIAIGHGSRSAESNAQFIDVVQQLAKGFPGDHVFGAYLEMTAPSLPAAMAAAVEHGADTILIIPCLLFTGVHVHEDIPQLIETFSATHPGITVRLGRAIGPDPLLAAILRARVEELI